MKITAHNLPEHLPRIPKMLKEKIRKECFPHYIIYKKHRNGSFDCYCTHCEKIFKMPSIHQPDISDTEYQFAITAKMGAPGECPYCKKEITFKPQGRITTLNYNKTFLIPLGITKTTGFIAQVYVELHHSNVSIEMGYGSVIRFKLYNIYRLENTNIKRYYPDFWSGECHLKNNTNGYVRYRQVDVLSYQPIYDYFVAPELLFKNKNLMYIKNLITTQRSNGTFMLDENVLKKIHYLLTYPALERLAKAGFEYLVNNIVSYNLPFKRVLNLHGKTIQDILKLPAEILHNIDKKINMNLLKIIQAVCKINKRVDVEKCQKLSNYWYGNSKIKPTQIISKTKLTPGQILFYLQKQMKKYNENIRDIHTAYTIYGDYLNECIQLEYDLTDTIISKPKDLLEKHSETSRLVAMTKDTIEQKRLEKIAEKSKKFNEKRKKELVFEWQDLICIVPESPAEIIAEGRSLSHCVGGYAERHASGKTTILFVREKKTPYVSRWTMELDYISGQWSIHQFHGYKNKDQYRREHFLNFQKAYEKHLKAVNATKNKNKQRVRVSA